MGLLHLKDSEKADLIIDLVKSLNTGNTGYAADRVETAIKQYNQLVENGIIWDDSRSSCPR